MKAPPHPGPLPLFPDLIDRHEAKPPGRTKGGQRPDCGAAAPAETVAPRQAASQLPALPPAQPDVHRPVLTVAELETKIAELDSEIAPLAKRRSEFLRKKRNLVATFEAAKARKANELSSAKVKSLAAKHGTNVKGVQKIARELKCTPRTVYRKLREE